MQEPAVGATAWHALPEPECLRLLQTGPDGLDEPAVRERRVRFGPNVFRRVEPVSFWAVLLAQFEGILTWLLVVAAAISLVGGDRADAIAILAVLALNVTIGVVTELRAHRAMEALLRLEVTGATVVRAGVARAINGSELVPGDIVLLDEGASVPADVRLLETVELTTTEASLTGESLPVAKRAGPPVAAGTPLADRVTMAWKGTAVSSGRGRAVVIATGMRTEVGRIGTLAGQVRGARSPLELRLERLGRRLAALALGAAALTAVIALAQGERWTKVVETALALAVAAVPEGLPVVATIAMAVGVRRMARRRALVRALPAVEALGSTTLVCTDKTGTLTAGEMTVTDLWLPGRFVRVGGAGYAPHGGFSEQDRALDPAREPALSAALLIGARANRARLTREGDTWVGHGDPTEAALLAAAAKAGLDAEALRAAGAETGELPFSSARMFMAVFLRERAGLRAMVKGAPHRIFDRCALVRTGGADAPFDAARRDAAERANAALAARGLRVLALAEGLVAAADEPSLHGLTLVGLVGLMDPPAAGVRETLATLRGAGLRIVMLTGDQRITAEAVARDLGFLDGDGTAVLDGAEIDLLDEQALQDRVAGVAAVSRVSPEAKLRLVRAWQRRGDIVAMLGDGINDAAALRQASVGVAMGRRGTDLAKEAADVILQDDRFETVAAAVEEGRVIFANIRRFVFYLFSCNLAEVLVVLGAGIAGWPNPLLPLQILWLNLVTDTFPALALAVEPAEPGVMGRPPRDPRASLLPAGLARATVWYGLAIAAVSLAAFAVGSSGGGASGARAATLAFMTLALAQAFHLGNARGRAPVLSPSRALANRWALGAVALVVGLQFASVSWAPLRVVLGLTRMDPVDWLLCGALAAVPAVGGQAVKFLARR